jgi:hypothetical protein
MLRKNVLGWLLTVALYAGMLGGGALLPEQYRPAGGIALLVLLLLHAAFGAVAYFLLAGEYQLRATLIFAAIIANAVAMAVIFPDPRHPFVAVFVSIPFGLIALSGVWFSGEIDKIRKSRAGN